MLFRLIPPAPHPTILYALTFPNVLPLPDLHPSATMPAAWSSQLHLLTSILQLEPPSSIHMLDRAVGLVARVHEVSMDVPRKEITVKFVDGRVMKIAMNSDCVRMLLAVVVDVKGCSEPEDQRNSLEGSTCAASTASSTEDLPTAGSPTKTQKLGKHKRQRSLLFSLISSLVPKSLSSSSPHPPPSSAPPPAPLPPLPHAGRMTPPASPQQAGFSPTQVDPNLLRRRARATLVDVWRRHVLSALSPQHLPPAGYVEWTLIAMASKTRAEIESIEAAKSHSFDTGYASATGSKHRKTRSEGRNALDFGDRSHDGEGEVEQRRCRAPSPFPGSMDTEDIDRVLYPRREEADEWGVRYAQPPRHDGAGIFAVEFNGHNESLLRENFTVGDDWDDDERLTFEFAGVTRHHTLSIDTRVPGLDDKRLNLDGAFHRDDSDDDCNGLADMAFDVSRSPIAPSDVNDDEDSDDSQTSLRTPEEGEELPLATPGVLPIVPDPAQSAAAHQYTSVARVASSRPRSRNTPAQSSSKPPTPTRPSHSPLPSTPTSSGHRRSTSRDAHVDELLASRYAHLERICHALELVRTRAREEGWRLVKATAIGAPIGWMDPESERSLEIKAKRRAWSAGIKISAPYESTNHSSFCSPFAQKVWDGNVPILRSPIRPPGLTSPSVPGPIVPTGLSLGVPIRSSPLAMYAWSADDRQKSTPSKYGALTSMHTMETITGKKTHRVTFADSTTKLFPVCEDESEDLFEPVQVNAVGFPQAKPADAPAKKPEGCPVEGLVENEDDPFLVSPCRPRTRTTSMYVISSTYSVPSSPVLPMFRPRTPPPSYQATIGEDDSTASSNEEGKLDPSALLCQPLTSLSISSPSPQTPPSRPPLMSNPPFVGRPRAVSLPTPKSDSARSTTRRTSSVHRREEYCEDLSQVYASPPPDGPIVVSATPAPHEQYPRYAHVHSPVPTTAKGMNASMVGKTAKEVVFEQAGSEFTVGIEVALGRAEEGRVVW